MAVRNKDAQAPMAEGRKGNLLDGMGGRPNGGKRKMLLPPPLDNRGGLMGGEILGIIHA
jgi:hypothetical protein